MAQVLLLSMNAGGVGINLTRANHLFLLEPHWNPYVESQVVDRIHRITQTKPVHVYKYVIPASVENKIQQVQEKKLKLAQALFSKPSGESTLNLEDLRDIFFLGN